MKRLTAPPSEVLTDEQWIQDEDKLRDYYLKISQGKRVYPITLILPEQYPIEEFQRVLKQNAIGLSKNRLECELFYAEKFGKTLEYHIHRGARYLLCDGNHRGIAYVLHERGVLSEIMETDKDLQGINNRFAKKGKYEGPGIMRRSATLKEYFFRVFRSLAHNEGHLITLQRKVECLQRDGEIRIEDGKLIYTPPKFPF